MKGLFSLCALLFLASPFYCQSHGAQIVIPQKRYIGDTVELHYSFFSEVDLLSKVEEGNETLLPLADLPYDVDNEDFLLKKAILQKNGKNYTLMLTFVPWKTGSLKIPAFNLADLISMDSAIPFMIDPDPFEVLSVISDAVDASLQGPCPPLLLPGTMYFMYAMLIILLVVVAIVVNVFIGRRKIHSALQRRMALWRYARNSRGALRSLGVLLKKEKSISDADFAFRLENILRDYLTVRFGRNFTVQVASQIGALIEDASGGFLDDKKQDASFSLTALFIRADYIRFARNSIDSTRLPKEKYNASFNNGEKESMVENARCAIRAFEAKTTGAKKEEVNA